MKAPTFKPPEFTPIDFNSTLFGAFRALGIDAAPRPNGKGITFACKCGNAALFVEEGSVRCPRCKFTAAGDPWEIAEKCKPPTGDLSENTKNLAKDIQDALFHPARRRPKSVPVYGIGGTPVCFRGDITVIEAQVKSGKSAFVGAAISSVFAEGNADCLGWMSKNPDGHAVIHFDTEQSGDDHDSLCERIQARANRAEYPGWLLSACVTGFGPKKLRAGVEFLLEQAMQVYGGIHSVLIDGVADFVNDVNDTEASNEVITWLMALAMKYKVPIIVVLHLNPITSKTQIAKARGHLGSQLYRKAAHVLRIEKDDDGVSTVTSVHARKAQVSRDQQPVFMWSDEARRHVSVNSKSFGEEARKRRDLSMIAVEAFGTTTDGMAFNELIAEVMKSVGCSRTTAANTVSEMRALGVVYQDKAKTYHLSK